MSLDLRARAASALLELAFNPHQRRDSKGRWARMPDSELKRPRRKRSDKKAAKEPALRSQLTAWLDLPTGEMPAAAQAELAQMFAMDDPATGLRAEVTRGHVQNGQQVGVWVDIRDKKGKRVGSAARILGVDPQTGERWVDHTNFNLDREVRSGGFSSRWLRQMEDRYREAGIDRITLSTANVGGYAWAKAGFDFDDAETAELQADMVRIKLDQKKLMTPEIDAQLADMKRRATSGNEDDRPTPMEMAMLGWTPGATTWPGKEAMLNTYWTGVKKL